MSTTKIILHKNLICFFSLFIFSQETKFVGVVLLPLISLKKWHLSALATEAAGELEVAGHEGDALGVEGAEVGVGEEAGDVGLGRLLEGGDGGRLPAEAVLVAGGELADEALEGGLAHQEVSGLLVLLDLAEGDGSRAPAELLGAGGLGSLGLSLAGLLDSLGDGGGLCLGHFVVGDFFREEHFLKNDLFRF